MTPALKRRVLDACRAQQARGVAVQRGVWGVARVGSGPWYAYSGHVETENGIDFGAVPGCACALGCLILEEQPRVETDSIYHALKIQLKATEHEIDSFTRGFDGQDFAPKWDLDWYLAGREVAAEVFDVPAESEKAA